jgi:hypothetical protein
MSGTAGGSWPGRKVTNGQKLVKNWSYKKSETAKLTNLNCDLSETAIKKTIGQK